MEDIDACGQRPPIDEVGPGETLSPCAMQPEWIAMPVSDFVAATKGNLTRHDWLVGCALIADTLSLAIRGVDYESKRAGNRPSICCAMAEALEREIERRELERGEM